MTELAQVFWMEMTATSRKLSCSSEFYERFADYFVICGLDEVEGLEPHQGKVIL